MKRLNQSWLNKKRGSVQAPLEDDRESGKVPVVRTRRRLGRFALVTRKNGSDVRRTETSFKELRHVPQLDASPEDGDERLPMSFLSSGASVADDDLLAEMDKVEAAMNDISSNHSTVTASPISAQNHSSEQTTSVGSASISADLSVVGDNLPSRHKNMDSRVGNKRKARRHNDKGISSPLDNQLDSYIRNNSIMTQDSYKVTLSKVNSPTSSPVDKRLKRTSPKPFTAVKSSRAPSMVGKGRLGNDLLSDRNTCNNISFSPLAQTPILSSDSSDCENDESVKCTPICRHSSGTVKGINSHSSNRTCKKKSLYPSVVETPKSSTTRKRRSPKMLLPPEVKISKSNQNKSSPPTCNVSKHKEASESRSNVAKSSTATKSTNSKNSSQLSHSPNIVQVDSPKQHEATENKSSSSKSMTSCKSRSELKTAVTNFNLRKQCRDVITNVNDSSSCDNPHHNGSTSTGTRSRSANSSVNISLTEDKRLLQSWGLPGPVLAAYAKQGVTAMFEWQAECLLSPSVLDGGNLIYSAPTSAGKTLVAEILVMKRVLEKRKKAMIILPFVSVAREKMFSLQRLYQDTGIRVGGFMGTHSPAGGFSTLDVAVCTIEKGNGLVNRLMEDGKIDDIGVVVVDELHMVGDSHRGYLLELMLTKLEFLSLRRNMDQRLQIIGMSATLPNLEVLAKWLSAALYRTDFRPVPLSEHIKIDDKLYDGELVIQRDIPSRFISPDDTDHVLALCLETVMGGHSVLLFCPTKNWCEKLCETIARKFHQIMHSQSAAEDTAGKENGSSSSTHIRLSLNRAGLKESIEQLRRCPVGVDPMVGKCLLNGVAYHHAGLTFDERDIIEGAFRDGHLRVLVATSTLSSGVNLPARRVIIRTPMFHGKVIDLLTFKQMSGRAGRKGVDTEGESVLICKPNERMKGKALLQSQLPPVESCLHFDTEGGLSRSLKRAILEVVVSGVTTSPEDVMSYIKCTLLSASMEQLDSGSCAFSFIDSCTAFLQDNEFVSLQLVNNEDGTESKRFFPTQLGSAILASSLSPDEGLLVFAELQKARRAFVLESELHVIYLVTPINAADIASSIDWYHYYSLWENLSPAERRVADVVGVSEAFIAQAIRGRINRKTEKQQRAVAVHHRFYTALVLNTLICEVPLMEVATKFNLNKGQLQSLQQSAATYTGMITVFCQRLGWHNLELILSRFQHRLSVGVQHELVDLVRISALTASSARMLFNAGYLSVVDVARAEAVEVEELFKTAVPFQSDKKQEGETDWEQRERQKTKCIWLTGRRGMTELDAAKEIIQEAKTIVQGDLGVKDIAWNSKVKEESCDDDSDLEDIGQGAMDVGNNSTNVSCESDKENCTNGDDMQNNSVHSAKSGHENMDVKQLNTSTKKKGVIISDTLVNFTKLKNKVPEKDKSLSIGRDRDDSLINTSFSASDTPKRSESHSCEGYSNDSLDKGKEKNLIKNVVNASLSRENKLRKKTGISRVSDAISRKSQGKKTRSVVGEHSKAGETSFFGQVVVTPPPGVLSPSVDNVQENVDKRNYGEKRTENLGQLDAGSNCGSKISRNSSLCFQNIVTEAGQFNEVLDYNNINLMTGHHANDHSFEQNGTDDVATKDHGKQSMTSQTVESRDRRKDDNFRFGHDSFDHGTYKGGVQSCHNVDSVGNSTLSTSDSWNTNTFLEKEKGAESLQVQDSGVLGEHKNSVGESRINKRNDRDSSVVVSKNCDKSKVGISSENFSFSESFILDTQTADLISAGCEDDNVKRIDGHKDQFYTSCESNPVSENFNGPFQNLSPSSFPSCNGKSEGKSGSRCDDFDNVEHVEISNAKNNNEIPLKQKGRDDEISRHFVNTVHSMTSTSSRLKLKLIKNGSHQCDSDKDDVNNGKLGDRVNVVNDSQVVNVANNTSDDANDVEQFEEMNRNMSSSSFFESPFSQRQPHGNHHDHVNEEEDDYDQPCSLLAASCYERVSNFDEGMLECSDNDPGTMVNGSLSELNIVRNNNNDTPPPVRKEWSSKTLFGHLQESNFKSKVSSPRHQFVTKDKISLKLKNDYNVDKATPNPDSPRPRDAVVSDTQRTDDSLLAAVDMDNLTCLSIPQEKIANKSYKQNDSGNDRKGITRKVFQNTNVEGSPITEQDLSENNVMCNSLTASLIDQVFAQCEEMKTSSPHNLVSRQKHMGHLLSSDDSNGTHNTSAYTTPDLRKKKCGGKQISEKHNLEISPVLWESNPNSLNNSSCNDGSDCVPPTPPDEISSCMSPCKQAYFSPRSMRIEKRNCRNERKTKRQELNLGPAVSLDDNANANPGTENNWSSIQSIGLNISNPKSNNDVLVREVPYVEEFNPRNRTFPEKKNSKGDITVLENSDVEEMLSIVNSPSVSPSQVLTQQSFTIIDVCAHEDLFQTFLAEWKTKSSFSLALACEKAVLSEKGKSPIGIGSRFSKRRSSHSSSKTAENLTRGLTIPNTNTELIGLAVTWEDRDTYYISLVSSSEKVAIGQECDPDDSLAEPALCQAITLKDRIEAVKTHLQSQTGSDIQTVQVYDAKTALTTLAKTVGVSLPQCEDPRVADWLREPGCRLKNLHRMVTTYLSDELFLLDEVGGGNGYQSLGCDIKSRISGRLRACTESILTRKLMMVYRNLLEEHELWQAFKNTEMPSLLTLARMELNGFGLSMSELESQKSQMKARLERLECQAYKIAGHVFSLTSVDDISKILYLELKLPLNGDPSAVPHLRERGARNRRITLGGTSKEILEKLEKFHPLPGLILEWRRISSALSKSLFSLQRSAQHCEHLDMMRVFGDCQVFTSTGRVSMVEPNIQNIPKDFNIEMNEVSPGLTTRASTSSSLVHTPDLSHAISLRKMFIPYKGGVILSADYSQLELRIIAHLSGDSKLVRILNTKGSDVFKMIAAQFKSLEVEEVTANDRQQAKQVCYGMLYGIGPKALGQQIGVDEDDAAVFMETFKSTYPGVRRYLRETVEFCQKNGYVKTLFNRRRYLPAIKHSNPHARAQAERQAVNTSVQGSAADLVKKAMTNIDVKLKDLFPDTRTSHTQRGLRDCIQSDAVAKQPQGAFFLLQLHDELIYEVNAKHLAEVAKLVKTEMETAAQLSVRMPVKVNTGPSWGQLEEYHDL